jgi:hypothetical protein
LRRRSSRIPFVHHAFLQEQRQPRAFPAAECRRFRSSFAIDTHETSVLVDSPMRPFPLILFFLVSAVALPSPASADARADVQHALERVVAAGGFRASVSGPVFGPGMPPTSGTIEVVFPDRIRARTELIDFVTLPSGAWIDVLGVWTPVSRDAIPVTAFSRAEIERAIASVRDVREEGRVRSHACEQRVYRFRASGQLPGAIAGGDAKIWICTLDGRPSKIEADDAGGGRLVVAFDWSRPARVEAPES